MHKIKSFHFVIILIFAFSLGHTQEEVFILTPEDVENNLLSFPNITEWKYKEGHNPAWAKPEYDDSNWIKLDSTAITNLNSNNSNSLEGWFRIKFRLTNDFKDKPAYIRSLSQAAQDIYLNGALVLQLGNKGKNNEDWKSHKPINTTPQPINLDLDSTYVLAIHFVDKWNPDYYILQPDYNSFRPESFIELQAETGFNDLKNYYDSYLFMLGIALGIDLLLALFFWGLALLNWGEKHLIFIAIVTTGLFLFALNLMNEKSMEGSAYLPLIQSVIARLGFVMIISGLLLSISQIFEGRITRWIKVVALIPLITILIPTKASNIDLSILVFVFVLPISLLIVLIKNRKKIKGPKKFVLAGIVLTSLLFISFLLVPQSVTFSLSFAILTLIFITFPVFLLCYVASWLTNAVVSERKKASELIKITEEKKDLLEKQNQNLEIKVTERTQELEQSLNNLKATQSQLIQSEKMASLGELTAGIAHEIQNPLNFVNNFSEVSNEMIQEIKEERKKKKDERDEALEDELLEDIAQNLEKINHHGKRADGIVKGMLQHSRASGDKKEPTDLNKLADEYLRLAYHGLRAKDKSFNAELVTDFDKNLPLVSVIPQDIGRVVLNLVTNAFYACTERSRSACQEKQKSSPDNYKPTVSITTNYSPLEGGKGGVLEGGKGSVQITVTDNGNGIPEHVLDKIFQPFFTTKPTGEGTGLGLSMSYDIITKGHGGELSVESKKGHNTIFRISLPLNKTN